MKKRNEIMSEDMKTEKNEGRGRKIVAGTLVGLGVLGLGMAAATQLNLGWAGQFQAGTVDVNADCQTGEITVSYDRPEFAEAAETPWSIANVNFAGIDDKCEGLNYQVAYKVSEGESWVEDATGKIPADADLSVAVPAAVDVQDIAEFALTIYSE